MFPSILAKYQPLIFNPSTEDIKKAGPVVHLTANVTEM